MTDWQYVSLGELVTVRHGFAFKGAFFEGEGDQLVLTPGNFSIGGGLQLRDGKERFYSGPYPDEYRLSPGELLVAMTDLTQDSPILGSPLLIPQDGVFLHNQRLGKVEILDENLLDKGFLYYLFVSDIVRSQLRGSATGSTVRHTAPGRICAARIQLPPLDVQKKIAAILSAYDDLIENNNRRIRLLEEMAQRIYREWFVDFRYPGHEGVPLVDSELGLIPEGWNWKQLRDIADEVRISVDPSTIDPGTPYVGLEHMPERSIALSEWGMAGSAGSRKFRFLIGDVLFGKIRPYFHKVSVPSVEGICSTDAIVIRNRTPGTYGLVLAVVSSEAFVSEAVQSSQGTKMPRANWGVLEKYPVAIPPQALLERFNSFASDTVSLIHRMVNANRNLRSTRELLLPRLISGKVDVTDLDIALVENAA